MNPNFCANKTNFHMKGFTLVLALKQRRNATWKLPILYPQFIYTRIRFISYMYCTCIYIYAHNLFPISDNNFPKNPLYVSHATLYIRPAFLKTKNSAKICQCLFVLSLPIFVIIMVQITRSTKLHFI